MSEEEALDALVDTAKLLNGWLGDVAVIDMDETVADGGITAAMVVQQEAGFQQKRLRNALQAVFDARLATPNPIAPRV
jgi:2-phospho-L-lactate guanylyltransferase (CobY/MobA/RfbA family)